MSAYELAQLDIGVIKGPTADAFTFREAYAPPDAARASPVRFRDECPAA